MAPLLPAAQRLGADGPAVLAETGFTPDEIDDLTRDGALKQPGETT
jgi:hypothetical protein